MFAIDDDFGRLAALKERFVMISGCSGGGKSTLLAALAARGFAVQTEPGRQIVREQLFIGGDAVPWGDMQGFTQLVLSRAMHQLAEAATIGRLTLFDRGLVDVYAWFRSIGARVPPPVEAAVTRLRYADDVFMAPPWPELFVADEERRHDFAAAEAEYWSLRAAYADLGYRLVELPRSDVESRVRFVADRLRG
ncbi:MAG TPA: AAA family ATPase [Kaistia sp.]|nr:AAA family ATPase [Kaistia sp.]